MNASLLLIQTVLGVVPNILQFAANIRATLSTSDQATLDAMIAAHHQAAVASVTQAQADLAKAAEN